MSNRVFAIGDIHGCFNPLKELIENKIQLQKNDKLIFLGDYIDRGTNSKEVVDYIIESPLITTNFQKVEKCIILGFLFIIILIANTDTIICIL